MIEREIDIPTPEGSMNTFIVAPERDGPHPAAILLMDAPGVREGLREIARRVAQSGYVVLLPNLYYRTTRDFVLGPTGDHPEAAANLKRMFGMIAGISNAKIAADVGTILDWLPGEAEVRDGKVGLFGYCMSGAFATVAAARHADRVGCFASFYGTRMISDAANSPHALLGDIKCEGYYAFAETDSYVPLEQVTKFEAMLARAPFPSRSEVEPGTEHGYAFSDRGHYHRAAAEKHYERLLALFRRNLA